MAVLLDPEEAEACVIHDLIDFTGLDVLDFDCGDGRMTWRFTEPTHAVLGIDPVAGSIETARATAPAGLRETVRFQVADVTTADLPRAAFDVAMLSWSLC